MKKHGKIEENTNLVENPRQTAALARVAQLRHKDQAHD